MPSQPWHSTRMPSATLLFETMMTMMMSGILMVRGQLGAKSAKEKLFHEGKKKVKEGHFSEVNKPEVKHKAMKLFETGGPDK